MNTLLVTHYYSTHQGGIEIVADQLARRLAHRHTVTWMASDCDAIPAGLPAAVRPVPMRAFNAIERWSGLPFPLWGPRSLRRLWHELRGADLVHLHDFAYVGNWIAFAVAVRRGVPVVITQHIGFVPSRSAVVRAVQRMLHATIGRLMLGGATQVVFVSRVVKEYYDDFVSYRRAPLVIANGVDGDTFTAGGPGGREQARLELGLEPQQPVLLFVGRFVEKKGLHLLAELVRRLPAAAWLFAGRGPIDPRSWNAPNVRVFENRRHAALVPLYRAADLLVLPSVGEGLPLVVQEAMSCGTPVLVGEDTARAVNAPADAVFGCRVGDHGDVDRWAAEILRILAGAPGQRSAIADFARAQWSWTSCAAAYSAVYHLLVQQHPGAVQNESA